METGSHECKAQALICKVKARSKLVPHMGSYPWEGLFDTYRWPWLACLPCPACLTPQPHWSRQPHRSWVTFVTFGTLQGNDTLVRKRKTKRKEKERKKKKTTF
ncbi:hypothetical protein E2C01_065982 [Portunus trituberculatus]|uniref:Uncharacterized protein n=1 Tax=Portunus trituberculatus TaxID=210409 RepID=A0A5B7HR52_PORTR|nr:hypothetical protein [Portunus trituberculatus]